MEVEGGCNGSEDALEPTFGSLLRRHRAAANMTQERLAERSGISVQAISALECGDRSSPRPSTIEYLAEALRLDSEQKQAFVAAGRWKPASDVRPGHRSGALPDSSSPTDGEALLASMPTDVPPPRAALRPGTRM